MNKKQTTKKRAYVKPEIEVIKVEVENLLQTASGNAGAPTVNPPLGGASLTGASLTRASFRMSVPARGIWSETTSTEEQEGGE